jgi:hypothetical protein
MSKPNSAKAEVIPDGSELGPYYTTADIATATQFSRRTVKKWIADRRLSRRFSWAWSRPPWPAYSPLLSTAYMNGNAGNAAHCSVGSGGCHEDLESTARPGARMSPSDSRPGGRREVERLAPVLSLDDALEYPEKLLTLPARRLQELLRAARRVVADLEYAAALATLPDALEPSDDQDRLLSRQEAASLLGTSPRFLKGRAIPGKVMLGKKTTAYRRADLLRFIKARSK